MRFDRLPRGEVLAPWYWTMVGREAEIPKQIAK
jgi:hypothetical protein